MIWRVKAARRIVAIAIILALTSLTPAAFADPPDPTWLAGFWDDDDFDSTVVFIAGMCAIDVAVGATAGPVVVVAAIVAPREPKPYEISAGTAFSPRGPPRPALPLV